MWAVAVTLKMRMNGLAANSEIHNADLSILLTFFFQAEDGIRDADVTGVQTCALPISKVRSTTHLRAMTTKPFTPSGRLTISMVGPLMSCRAVSSVSPA